jgi:hypothetical protein
LTSAAVSDEHSRRGVAPERSRATILGRTRRMVEAAIVVVSLAVAYFTATL